MPVFGLRLGTTSLSFLCAISLGTIGANASRGDTMKFTLQDDTPSSNMARIALNGGRYDIYATGTIDADAAKRLREFIAANGIEHARILFDSPGGSLIGGMRLGEAIRELGFETEIRSIEYEYDKGPVATCASACSYAFAGGVSRFFDDRYARLGLHQFYDANTNTADVGQTQVLSGLLVSYLDRMGVNPKSFAIASMTDKSTMTWLTTTEAEKIGFADNGVLPTTAEVKLAEGFPYLKLEQKHHDVTSRILITCHESQFGIMGGIVTTPENSAEQISYFGISYIEFDQTQYRRENSLAGVEHEGSTIWVGRELDSDGLTLLKKSEMLGMWLENGGFMRWGAFLDLRPVRANIDNFLANCQRR